MSYSTSALSKYRTVSIATSSPAQIVVMLYDGIFRFLREAMVAIEAGDRAKTGERIGRAHAILKHLLGSMVPEANPLLHERLTQVYLFSMHHSTAANLKQDAAMLREVIAVLLPLRSAWSATADRVVRETAGAANGAEASAALAKTG
jgi:flagellar protein FliS